MRVLDNSKVYTREEISLVCLSAPQLAHAGRPVISRMLSELYSPKRQPYREIAESAVPLFYAKAYRAGAAKQVWGAASLVYVSAYSGVVCALCLSVWKDRDEVCYSKDDAQLAELLAPGTVWAPVRDPDGNIWWGPPPICSDCEVALAHAISDVYGDAPVCGGGYDELRVVNGLSELVTSKRKVARRFRERMARTKAAPNLRLNPRKSLAPSLVEIGARAEWFDFTSGGLGLDPMPVPEWKP